MPGPSSDRRMMKPPKVLDVETTSSNPWDSELICVGWGNVTYQEPGRGSADASWLEVQDDLADPEQPIITHTDFDTRYLTLKGWDIRGPVYDTQVMAWRVNENTPLGLDYLTEQYTNDKPKEKRIKPDKKVLYFYTLDGERWPLTEWRTWPSSVYLEFLAYNETDLSTTQSLFKQLRWRMTDGYPDPEQSLWAEYLREEVPFTNLLLRVETTGIPIDLEASDKLHAELEVRAEEAGKNLLESFGYEFNLNSGDQLAEVLFKPLWYQPDSIPHGLDLRKPTLVEKIHTAMKHIDPKVTKKAAGENTQGLEFLKQELVANVTPPGFEVQKVTPKNLVGFWTRKGMGFTPTPPTKDPKTGKVGKRPSTATPTLLVHHADKPIIKELVAYRKLRKILTTYTGVYHRFTHEGRLYGRFNQTGTKTGRLSSSGPNLQNQPAHGELGERIRSLFRGNLIVGDYSQLEPRLMAHFSGDPVLVDTYANGKDIYLVIASIIFGDQLIDRRCRVHGKNARQAKELATGTQLEEWQVPMGLPSEPSSGVLLGSTDGAPLDSRAEDRKVSSTRRARPSRQREHNRQQTRESVRSAETDSSLGCSCDPKLGVYRQISKTYVLALGYGAGPKKLREILALNGFWYELAEVEAHFARLQQDLHVFFDWKESIFAQVRRRGFVRTIGGRKRHLRYQFKNTSWRQQGYGERQAVNAIVQGSAGDVVRRGMLKADELIPELPQIFQVHDEVGFDHTGIPAHVATSFYAPLLQEVFENKTGFDLRVPLVFEPFVVTNWGEKGGKASKVALEEEDVE